MVFDPQGPAEQAIVAALRRRGWALARSSRDGGVLRVDVVFEDRRGTIHIAYESVKEDDPAPAFVRVDLGERAGRTLRWRVNQVLSERVHETGEVAPRYSEVFQLAIGDAWATVGLGMQPTPTADNWARSIERLLGYAESIGPARPMEARSAVFGEIAAAGRAYERSARWKARAALVVLWVLALVGVALSLLGIRLGDPILGGMGAFVAVFATPVIIRLVRRSRRGEALRWHRPIEALRESGVFDRVDRGRVEVPLGVPVLCDGPARSLQVAPFVREAAHARSSRHMVTGRLELARIHWPIGTLELCRVVPTGYMAISLSGPRDLLDALPRGPGERRREDSVAWTLTDADFDAGSHRSAFASLAESLRLRPKLPYR